MPFFVNSLENMKYHGAALREYLHIIGWKVKFGTHNERDTRLYYM